MSRMERTIEATEDGEVLALLTSATGLSKTRLKHAMSCGAVWLTKNGKSRRVRRATAEAKSGDSLTIHYDEKILDAETPPPRLIADHSGWSVWFKPAGVRSSGSRFGDHTAIDRLVEKQIQRPTFLVHRLDQFAAGLMVLAHNKNAAAALSRQFHDRTVTKVYQAIVGGVLASPQTISVPLDERDAITHVTPLESSATATLVEVRIETGRKHQIRRHLAHIGHPVDGDRQYGEQQGSLQLVACELSFAAPWTRAAMRFELPDEDRPTLTRGA